MYNLPHIEQTSKMNSLFEELRSKEMVQALEKNQTSILLEEVKKANIDFLNKYQERSKKQSQDDDVESIPDTRKKIRTAIDGLLQFIEIMVKYNKDRKMSSLYEQLENLVEDTNQKIKTRLGRNNKDEISGDESLKNKKPVCRFSSKKFLIFSFLFYPIPKSQKQKMLKKLCLCTYIKSIN